MAPVAGPGAGTNWYRCAARLRLPRAANRLYYLRSSGRHIWQRHGRHLAAGRPLLTSTFRTQPAGGVIVTGGLDIPPMAAIIVDKYYPLWEFRGLERNGWLRAVGGDVQVPRPNVARSRDALEQHAPRAGCCATRLAGRVCRNDVRCCGALPAGCSTLQYWELLVRRDKHHHLISTLLTPAL